MREFARSGNEEEIAVERYIYAFIIVARRTMSILVLALDMIRHSSFRIRDFIAITFAAITLDEIPLKTDILTGHSYGNSRFCEY